MPILKNVLLKDYAYYATGGTADILYAPETVEELAACVKEVQTRGQRLFLLGGGTNSLVMDEPFRGAFIMFRGFAEMRRIGTTFVVGAGVENSAVASMALTEGLAGAAWMYRLPGQVGGTVRMNARCYGGEISQIVTRVTAVTRMGEVRIYKEPSMFRGYKDTVFMDNGDLIAEVDLSLAAGDGREIERQMLHCEKDREAKGQFDFPSCGCVFKNDYAIGVPSGMLLEAVGCKGLKHGGAEVSPHHANFVFNKGASSRAILELTLEMRERVYRAFGAWLEYEMELLGDVPLDLARRVSEGRPVQLNLEALRPLRESMAARGSKA